MRRKRQFQGRNRCPRCNYIGNQHLCNCVWKIGDALRKGDIEGARVHYGNLVNNANNDERARRGEA
jgi:hypothetical protein